MTRLTIYGFTIAAFAFIGCLLLEPFISPALEAATALIGQDQGDRK